MLDHNNVNDVSVVRLLVPLLMVIGLFLLTSIRVPFVSSAIQPPSLSAGVRHSIASTTISAVEIKNPTLILIPSIELSAKIQSVGRNQNGNMSVPTNFIDVGWYEDGYLPGQNGNAVIAGHVSNSLGLPAVFSNLNKIKIGDIILVEDNDGTVVAFKVVDIQTYEYDKAPIKKIFGPTETKNLNLITCSGEWISTLRTNSHRLVVYSELVTL